MIRVFPTRKDAVASIAEIDKLMGYPKASVDSKGRLHPEAMTLTWAKPEEHATTKEYFFQDPEKDFEPKVNTGVVKEFTLECVETKVVVLER